MKKIILFFGPPGSGKDTQAQKLSDKLGIPLISTGEILRAKAKKNTDLGKKIHSLISRGKLAPTYVVEKVLDERLKTKDTQAGFILDGYPRNKLQLEHFKKKLQSKKEQDSLMVLAFYINVSDQKVKERLGGRRVCRECGHTYHLKYNPPQQDGYCDKCGGELYQRNDDSPQTIEERLKIYHKRIDPLLEYFRDKGQLININGHPSIEEVEAQVVSKAKKSLPEL